MSNANTADPIGTVGFIGVGEIAKAMIEGLATAVARPLPIVLSPRGREHAEALSSRFDTVRIAESNGDVVDASDTVVLAVRPEQLSAALDGVRFRSSQVVVSALAGVDIAELRSIIGTDVPVIRSIPLPPVSRRSSQTVICPEHPVAASLFERLGGSLAVADETELAVFSAITGSFTGLLQYVATIVEWAERQGAPAQEAERFIRTAFAELAPALRDGSRSLDGLIKDHETSGGLNEQLRRSFFDERTVSDLSRALDDLHGRDAGEDR